MDWTGTEKQIAYAQQLKVEAIATLSIDPSDVPGLLAFVEADSDLGAEVWLGMIARVERVRAALDGVCDAPLWIDAVKQRLWRKIAPAAGLTSKDIADAQRDASVLRHQIEQARARGL